MGADLDQFQSGLATAFKQFNYRCETVRVSEIAEALVAGTTATKHGSEEFRRLHRLMNLGNAVRAWGGGEALALAVAAWIGANRRSTRRGRREPFKRTVHIIRSLKHPGEVQALRRIYGPGFFLVGVVASVRERRAFLKERHCCTDAEIDELFARDEREANDLGQRTRDSFYLSDVFLPASDGGAVRRFVDLAFGTPCETPSSDEYAMYLAFSAALRSADLSQQVGAVLVSQAGDPIAVGTNDVPRAGGGLFWPGPDDRRDWTLGFDTNEAERARIIDQVLDIVRPRSARRDAWRARGWRILKAEGALVLDITEYGRAVHAEMEALLACARSGIATRGATLYTTTFPCHNCAKHILAAGLSRVVYVEPYPKSRAAELYPESIVLDRVTAEDGQVPFCPFEGIGPRRFNDLFSIGMSSGYPVKRKEHGKVRAWHPLHAELRVPLLPNSYMDRETAAAEQLLATKRPRSRK